jgi:hypothetical protein
MVPRTLVVQARTGLPTVAESHIRIGILSGSLHCLLISHARGKNADVFTLVASHYGLR